MKKSRNIPLLMGGLLLAVLLTSGLHALFSLRFSSGDIYPAYSSYRADPMGTKILFRSLEEMSEVQVSRKIHAWKSASSGQDACMLVLGAKPYAVRSFLDRDDEWCQYLSSGGRLILAFHPERKKGSAWQEFEASADEEDSSDEAVDDAEIVDDGVAADDGELSMESLPVEGFNVDVESFDNAVIKDESIDHSAFSEGDGSFIPWHGITYFTELDDGWKVLYRFNEQPVVIERDWGGGSLVLMSDSYLFSNESMVLDRYTAILMRLIGSPRCILFDEYHLGVVSQENIMMLIARYRLRGVLAALLVLAGLFIWQRTSSLIPHHAEEIGENNTVGSWVGSGDGFRNLLVRRIPVKTLAETMVEEWQDTFSVDPSMQARNETVRQVYHQILKEGSRPDPLLVYNRVVEKLKERKQSWRTQ
ncbi:MAG: hypothetical protein JXR25_14390 [Pontiellaceae bacterium]|nr:hypothetical protein [Pontiellaceae bacterium]MBN2786008.1 hypothetical protein [Pontiellaceae bacterium]